MTQSARPHADHTNNYPNSDAGPYSADQWAKIFQVVFTGDQQVSQGVLVRYLNELEVTEAAGTLTVDTGAGICNGRFLDNDKTVAITPPGAGIGTRTDVVVMLTNNTALPVNAGIASGNALAFPSDLTDYAGVEFVPEYSTRLCVLRGTLGAGVAPTLDVDPATLFMVPLLEYDISAAVVSNMVDVRAWCEFSSALPNYTRRFLVPAVAGVQTVLTTNIVRENNRGLLFADNVFTTSVSGFLVPDDFVPGTAITVKSVWRTGSVASGNVYIASSCVYGQCAQFYAAYSDSLPLTATAIASSVGLNRCLQEITLSNPKAGDIVSVGSQRDAVNPLDTLNDDFFLAGWLVEYVANVSTQT